MMWFNKVSVAGSCIVLLLLCFQGYEVVGFSTGSGSCADGEAQVTPGHLRDDGEISAIPVTLNINGVDVQPGSTTTIPPTAGATLKLTGSVKGFSFRVAKDATISTIDTVNHKVNALCIAPVSGVTHINSNAKTDVLVTLTPSITTGTIPLQLIIVNQNAAYYYSTYTLNVAAVAVVPTGAPVVVAVVPTSAPVPVPAPIPVPVPVPVPVVTAAPVAAPTSVPVPKPVTAIIPIVTKSPSVRAKVHSSVRNPHENVKDARVVGVANDIFYDITPKTQVRSAVDPIIQSPPPPVVVKNTTTTTTTTTATTTGNKRNGSLSNYLKKLKNGF